MTPAAALLALHCYAVPPAPIVSDAVHRALLGEPVPAAPTRAEISAALAAAAPRRRARP